MLKLITVLVAAVPVVLLVYAVAFRRSRAVQRAFADFRRQVDYLSWSILILVGCAIVYSLGRLAWSFWD